MLRLIKNCVLNVRTNGAPILSRYIDIKHSKPFTTEEHSDVPNIQEITEGNPELEHKLRVLILETEVLRQEGRAVPENAEMKTANWKELLKFPSISARKRYLEFLFKVAKKKENRMRKKIEKREIREQTPKPVYDPGDVSNYNLGGNHFLLRIYDTTINQLHNNRLIQAMQFGQKVVVDCGYYNNMTVRENSNCAKQLMFLFGENRDNDEPFDLHYCNVAKDTDLMRKFYKYIPTMYDPHFPIQIHEESYLDIFPKEKLVYLTPDTRNVLKEYDHDAIYIIGGIVDKAVNEPLSLAKAKKEGLKMAKLPLDYYLEWGSGSGKSLTINQIISILLDMKQTGNWEYAFRHVPRRKLMDPNQPPTTNSKMTSWKPKLGQLQYNRRSQINLKNIIEE